MTFNDLDVVVARSMLENGIQKGSIGTVVHVFSDPAEAYLVEFANEQGETLAISTVLPSQIDLIDLREAD